MGTTETTWRSPEPAADWLGMVLSLQVCRSASTAADTAAKTSDSGYQVLTGVEFRPSTQAAMDAPGQAAHSHGSERGAAARRGCRPGPRGVWAVAPAVSTPHCLRGTRQDLPCTSTGRPRTPSRPSSGPLDPVRSGQPRPSPGNELPSSADLTAMCNTPSKLVMRVRGQPQAGQGRSQRMGKVR
jgi:hypothetical protein